MTPFFHLNLPKYHAILYTFAGLVYRYYSSFPSWLGGFDSRILLQKQRAARRAALCFWNNIPAQSNVLCAAGCGRRCVASDAKKT